MARNILGHRASPWLGFIPAFVFIGFFALLPALVTLGLSFTDSTGSRGVPINFIGLTNYVHFFSSAGSGKILNALQNTLVFAVATTVLINVFAFLIAVLLNRQTRFATFTRSVVFLPTVLGVAVVGMIWTLFFNPLGGPAQDVLHLFGTQSSFFGDQKLAFALVIFVNLWMYVGYSVVIYISGLQAVPGDLYEAAEIDGANWSQRTRLITLPMIAPAVTTNVLICIIGALQSYQLIFVLTGAANPSTSVLALELFRLAFGSGGTIPQQGLASAISIVQFAMVGVIAVVSFIILRRREQQL
jgi:ABC-type sugar transport system permease subunit